MIRWNISTSPLPLMDTLYSFNIVVKLPSDQSLWSAINTKAAVLAQTPFYGLTAIAIIMHTSSNPNNILRPNLQIFSFNERLACMVQIPLQFYQACKWQWVSISSGNGLAPHRQHPISWHHTGNIPYLGTTQATSHILAPHRQHPISWHHTGNIPYLGTTQATSHILAPHRQHPISWLHTGNIPYLALIGK